MTGPPKIILILKGNTQETSGGIWIFMDIQSNDDSIHTVDGSEIPNNHLGCTKPSKSWDFSYQPQLLSLQNFWLPSTGEHPHHRATPKASAVLFIGDKVPQRWGRSRSEKRRS